jgi:hypothetical protein
MTSIVVVETESQNLTFQTDEDKTIQHLESMADQIITFENEMKMTKLSRGSRQAVVRPILPVKPGQVYPNQAQWVNPFLLPTI